MVQINGPRSSQKTGNQQSNANLKISDDDLLNSMETINSEKESHKLMVNENKGDFNNLGEIDESDYHLKQ